MASAESDVKLQDFANIFSLKGKVAVVSGGSRGLGLHAASGFVVEAGQDTRFFLLTMSQASPSRLLQGVHHQPQSQRVQ